jgi:hypothetical protein
VNLGRSGRRGGYFCRHARHSGLVQATAGQYRGRQGGAQGQDQADVAASVTAPAQRGSLGGQSTPRPTKSGCRPAAPSSTPAGPAGRRRGAGGRWLAGQGRPHGQRGRTPVARAGSTDPRRRHRQRRRRHRGAVERRHHAHGCGTISARGGAQGGNGGQVETSGKVWLDVQSAATVNARAASRAGRHLAAGPLRNRDCQCGGPGCLANVPRHLRWRKLQPVVLHCPRQSSRRPLTQAATSPSRPPSRPRHLHPTNRRSAWQRTSPSRAARASTLKLVAHGDVQVDPGVTIKSTSGQLNLDFQSGYSFDSTTCASSSGGTDQARVLAQH